jgi:hypothetical protein
MLSTEYRGVHRKVWSPYGAQFGEEFGEESSSDLPICLAVLNTWSWTERTRNRLLLSRAVTLLCDPCSSRLLTGRDEQNFNTHQVQLLNNGRSSATAIAVVSLTSRVRFDSNRKLPL